MSNFSLTRPTGVRLCSTASAYLAVSSASAKTLGADLGSCREFSFEITGETLKATSSKNADAVVATAYAGMAGTITMVLEEMTSSAMAAAWLMTGSASYLYTDGSATAPTDYGVVAYNWPIDGSSTVGVFFKCNIQPGSVRKLGRDQELLEVKFDVLVDPSASATKQWFAFTSV